MTLKDKLGLAIWLAVGGVIGGGIGYGLSKRIDEIARENIFYMAEIAKPDVLIPLGDIDNNGFRDYIVMDSFEDKEGNNKDVGRGFLFLGHKDGMCYPVDRFSYTKEKRKELLKTAEEMAKVQIILNEKKKN
ncbi:MAG: hypothetical protein AABX83_03865 [Nanoarchaeota archaeon]